MAAALRALLLLRTAVRRAPRREARLRRRSRSRRREVQELEERVVAFCSPVHLRGTWRGFRRVGESKELS